MLDLMRSLIHPHPPTVSTAVWGSAAAKGTEIKMLFGFQEDQMAAPGVRKASFNNAKHRAHSSSDQHELVIVE